MLDTTGSLTVVDEAVAQAEREDEDDEEEEEQEEEQEEEDGEADHLWLEPEDVWMLLAAPVAGRQSATPMVSPPRLRIAACVGVRVDVEEPVKDSHKPVRVTIGPSSPHQRRLVAKYVRLFCKARQSWAAISETDDDGDLTILDVPGGVHQFVSGRQGSNLQSVGEDSSTLVFFINDEESPAGSLAGLQPKAPEPWLAPGRRVEVKCVAGDIRKFEIDWVPATVIEVLRAREVMVKLDTGGEMSTDVSGARPWYELGELVDVRDETGAWTAATVEARCEDGKLTVRRFDDGDEIEATAEWYDVRHSTQLKPEEDKSPDELVYRLAIFGSLQNRCYAQLKFMAAVEQKRPGYYPKGVAKLCAAPSEDWDVECLQLGQEFLPQCIGQKGAMRKKLCRAAGCVVEYLGTTAWICGPSRNRAFCRVLIEILRSSEKGNVKTVPEEASEYCETLQVPEGAMAFVTGSRRNWLNKIEEEEGVITFSFGNDPVAVAKKKWRGDDSSGSWTWTEESGWLQQPSPREPAAAQCSTAQPEDGDDLETLEKGNADTDSGEAMKEVLTAEAAPEDRKILIYAALPRSRQLARLRLEATVENKSEFKGHYSEARPTKIDDGSDLGLDVVELSPDEVSWASGKKGMTRFKLQAASGCGMEYFDRRVILVGTGPERMRGRTYLQWLLMQRGGSERKLALPRDVLNREDVTVVWLTTQERERLDIEAIRAIEHNTSTFLFFRDVPGVELLERGALIELRRADRTVIAEILEVDPSATKDNDDGPASSDDDGCLSLRIKLRGGRGGPSGGAEDSVVSDATEPLLVFGHDAGVTGMSGRSLAEQQVREAIADPSKFRGRETAEDTGAKDRWEEAKDDSSWWCRTEAGGRVAGARGRSTADNTAWKTGNADTSLPADGSAATEVVEDGGKWGDADATWATAWGSGGRSRASGGRIGRSSGDRDRDRERGGGGGGSAWGERKADAWGESKSGWSVTKRGRDDGDWEESKKQRSLYHSRDGPYSTFGTDAGAASDRRGGSSSSASAAISQAPWNSGRDGTEPPGARPRPSTNLSKVGDGTSGAYVSRGAAKRTHFEEEL